MNRDFIEAEMLAAMRARDKSRLSVLRLVKNELDIKEKDTRTSLSDEDITATVKKVLKQTAETLEGSIKVGTNAERTALLTEHVGILTAYLPAQVTGDALSAIVEGVLASGDITGKRDMGRAIGLVTAECGGNCDKAEVARIVGAKLA